MYRGEDDPRDRRVRIRIAWRARIIPLAIALIALTACEPPSEKGKPERPSDSGPFDLSPPPPDPGPRPRDLPSKVDSDDPPRFLGISQLIADDGTLTIQWEAAIDDVTPKEGISYRVYTSTERQDESKFTRPPAALTEPGASAHRLTGLPNGETVFVVVRAVDALGNVDDNELEWAAMPNPVYYVEKNAPPGGDGRSAEAPLPDLVSAISAAIPHVDGVNIYVSEGEYELSTRLLIFDGMMLYGGFPAGFPLAISQPRKHPTTLTLPLADTMLTFVPGKKLSGIDGCEIHGRGTAKRGIAIEDSEFRISNCRIQSFAGKGIQLKSDTKPNSVTVGEISRCWIADNQGAGIDLRGIFDVAITGCGLYKNRGPAGIHIEELTATPEEKSRVTIEGCRIDENTGLGIFVRTYALPDDGSRDSRIRLKVRSCEVANNWDTGIGVDVGYPDDAGINLRVRIEQCRVQGNGTPENGKSGIRIDGDARGHFQLTRNQVIGNRGPAGIHLTGDGPVSLYQIQSCAILANEGDGVRLDSSGHLSLDHSHIAGNGGAAFYRRDDTWLRVEDCFFHDNAVPAEADLLDHNVASDGQLARQEGEPGAPWIPTLPRRVHRLAGAPGTEPVIPDSIADGAVIEWLDDGVPRRLTRDGESSRVEPPLEVIPQTGVPFIYDWGVPEEGATFSVTEDYRPPVGSRLRDAGNPEEIEADGSIADVGPAGAFYAGHPGIDRGGPPPPRGLELSTIEPAAGQPIDQFRFELQFTGADELPADLSARIEVNGTRIPGVRIERDGVRMRVRAGSAVPPDAKIRFILPSWSSTRGRKQPIDHVFEYRGAHTISATAPIDALPAVQSRLTLPEKETRRLELAPSLLDEAITLTMRGVDPYGPSGWQLRVLDARGEVIKIEQNGTEVSLIAPRRDARPDGPLRLRIPAMAVDGPLFLEIDPPGDPSSIEDATVSLRVER